MPNRFFVSSGGLCETSRSISSRIPSSALTFFESTSYFQGGNTIEVSISGVIGTSSTAELRSSMNELIRVYVFECRKACKSEGETICLVGMTYSPSGIAIVIGYSSIRVINV